ncbi:MAG TPA: nitrilase-related carbon-nitrogen hydrolase, partial [Caldimonas sp.]|nr:nitrilase-related carbon-nitrogen hydrolase [Caldimonas sp.]
MTRSLPFRNPYRHDFVRVGVGVPRLRVADPDYNAKETVALLERACAEGVVVVVFPELGLAGYTCDDLFHQQAVLDAAEKALSSVLEATRRLPLLAAVGLPLRVEQKLFNCAAIVHGGRVLGVVPKTYLPNYGEFYEARQFAAAEAALSSEIEVLGQTVPFGNDLVFRAADLPLLALHAEICEDLWVPIPPSSYAALAGATVLLNLSASNVTVGKAGYRRDLVSGQSARCLAAYLYSAS